ncbi:MAG: glycosyl hydrolase family 8 [Candidatus Dormibacteria bacterium]
MRRWLAARRRVMSLLALMTASLLVACDTTPTLGASPSSATVASVLAASWAGYQRAFMAPDGRVLDLSSGGRTTSEGQSYALLRAAWTGDASTFAAAWRWTQANLQVRGDGLFAWLWEPGRGVVDHSSASDADSDIALALLLGSRRFGDAAYGTAALRVLDGMWSSDVADVAGMHVLTAGSWGPGSSPVAVDPSYFAPYAYRIFAAADPAHPWGDLVDSSYTVLQRCTAAPLGSGHGVGLPPNWCGLRGDGSVTSLAQMSQADAYGYDAFRVLWRLALDWQWNHEARARAYLEGASFLRDRWRAGGRVDPVYGHDGTVLASSADPTGDAGVLALCSVIDPSCAAQVRGAVLATLNPRTGLFGDPTNYYQQNWAWFGLALSAGLLPNLWENHL